MRLLVTGGAGFMGSDFIRFVLGEGPGRAGSGAGAQGGSGPGAAVTHVINLDALTYAGNPRNVQAVADDPRYRFVRGDICDPALVEELVAEVDAVVHFAAESHVDRSIQGDAVFVRTNVEGTRTLLAAARWAGVKRFVHVSTDEVYGHLPWRDPVAEPTERALERFRAGEEGASPFFTEKTPLGPRSPYSASKAASDLLALAYHRTWGLPVVVTRASNNYGPCQYPEKLIPLMVTRAMAGKPLPVYGDGLYVRDWLHVRDHSRGVWAALERGGEGEVYNLGGLSERTNLQVVRGILRALGKDQDLIESAEDRPGHDRRYAMDPGKAEGELGWRPEVGFEEGLEGTIEWYGGNGGWWG
jgi:dTDP-glucose 4,6-dehydratase